jgi:hypothetical protein
MFDRARAVTQVAKRNCQLKLTTAASATDAALSRGDWRFCRVCRCAWKVSAIDGQTYATAIHSPAHAIRGKGSRSSPLTLNQGRLARLDRTGGATRQIDAPNKRARYSLAWPTLYLIQFRGWIFPAVR